MQLRVFYFLLPLSRRLASTARSRRPLATAFHPVQDTSQLTPQTTNIHLGGTQSTSTRQNSQKEAQHVTSVTEDPGTRSGIAVSQACVKLLFCKALQLGLLDHNNHRNPWMTLMEKPSPRAPRCEMMAKAGNPVRYANATPTVRQRFVPVDVALHALLMQPLFLFTQTRIRCNPQ
jgi:hypothetical protein